MSDGCEKCRKTEHLGLQAKLQVGDAGDVYEREADRVADQVMSTSPHSAVTGLVPRIQRLAGPSTGESAPVAPTSVEHALAGPGRPLERALRQDMEQRFGSDFSRVRVHSGESAARSAQDVNAKAYTVGHDIVFAASQFAPGTHEGRRLLAHELTHVVQQGEGSAGSVTERRVIRTSPDDGKLAPKTAAADPPSSADTGSADPSQGRLAQAQQPPEARVKLMTFDCKHKLLVIDAGAVKQSYRLETCVLPLGSFAGDQAPTVIHQGQHKPGSYERDVGVGLKFPVAAEGEKLFTFSYSLKPGKPNPATLLAGQDRVDVEVVENLRVPAEGGTGAAKEPSAEKPQTPTACVIRLNSRRLVPGDSQSRPLFKPLSLNQTVWTQSIPLGQFGFVDVEGQVTGELSGTLSGSYGPGMLTDICLTSNTDKIGPDHPLLKLAGNGNVILGGRARFRLPASARAVITGQAALIIAADYLKVIRVGSIKGGVDARGEAALDGRLDAMVDVVAVFNESKSEIDKIDLNAKVTLQGHATLAFTLNAFVAAKFLGFEIWREDWRLTKAANLGLGWAGGIRYSPNPGIHWLPGAIDKLVAIDRELTDDEEAQVNEDDVLGGLLDQSRGTPTTPDGLSRQNALVFSWHKPIDFYPKTLDIPNAVDPQTLDRDDGPTTVTRSVNQGGGRSKTEYERIGVARSNWVRRGDYLQYVPHAVEDRREQDRLRDLLTDLGFDTSGTEVDHVRDLHLGGKDHFSNLWPLDQATNSAAGPRHQRQLENYEQQFAARNLNLNGRIFVISDVGL